MSETLRRDEPRIGKELGIPGYRILRTIAAGLPPQGSLSAQLRALADEWEAEQEKAAQPSEGKP